MESTRVVMMLGHPMVDPLAAIAILPNLQRVDVVVRLVVQLIDVPAGVVGPPPWRLVVEPQKGHRRV